MNNIKYFNELDTDFENTINKKDVDWIQFDENKIRISFLDYTELEIRNNVGNIHIFLFDKLGDCIYNKMLEEII